MALSGAMGSASSTVTAQVPPRVLLRARDALPSPVMGPARIGADWRDHGDGDDRRHEHRYDGTKTLPDRLPHALQCITSCPPVTL